MPRWTRDNFHSTDQLETSGKAAAMRQLLGFTWKLVQQQAVDSNEAKARYAAAPPPAF